MMTGINRIALISDLHLDSWMKGHFPLLMSQNQAIDSFISKYITKHQPTIQADMWVIAGDVANGGKTESCYLSVDNVVVPVVYVPGNHDYYGKSLPTKPPSINDNGLFVSTL